MPGSRSTASTDHSRPGGRARPDLGWARPPRPQASVATRHSYKEVCWALSPDTSCTHNRKELVMKGLAARLLIVVTLAISAGLVSLPTVVHAGLTATAAD